MGRCVRGTIDTEDNWHMVLVLSLGATVLQKTDGGDSPDSFQVYADPAGHPFCLCWIKPRDH